MGQTFSGKRWSPRGLHCYVTGGSQGLGLALAVLLVQEGAGGVSVVSRNKEKLAEALKVLEAARVHPDQKLNTYSHDLHTPSGAEAALADVCAPFGGRAPDAIFMCAGQAQPAYFIETTPEQLQHSIDANYLTSLWTSWAATRLMVRQRVRGKLVLVSSTLGMMSFVGYAPYSPMRWAQRGLVETLRSELLLYDIDVHIFFPNTMLTPGLVEENKTKPAPTLKIEETDTPVKAEDAARALLTGVKKGQCHIAGDLITNIFRASTRGSAPYHNWFVDSVLGTIGWIGVPIWRWGADDVVRKHRREHEEYLKGIGFYTDI